MNRLFGKKDTAPKVTLNDAIGLLDERVGAVDAKLSKINTELQGYQQRMLKMRDGPGKNALRQKAMKVLRQRKQLEAQKDQLEAQLWNMQQAQMTTDNLKNTMVTVDAMKTANRELKRTYGKMDIDKIERLQDEMLDLIEQSNDLQESLSLSYAVPEEVSDGELDAELEALGDWEPEVVEEGEVPSYLQDGLKDAPTGEVAEEPGQMLKTE